MDSSPIDSPDEQTFHLIRLPKSIVEQAASGNTRVGTVTVDSNGLVELKDDNSGKLYTLIRNVPLDKDSNEGSQATKIKIHDVSTGEKSDLFKISLQKEETMHIGKVKPLTLLAVPKDDGTDVSTVYE